MNGDLLIAPEATFYVRLYQDKECTEPVSEIKTILFKNASASTVEFTGLESGQTYYVRETDEAGNILESGITADGTVYLPAYPNGDNVTINAAGQKATLVFENQFAEWPDGFYKEAKVNITKKLLGADGKQKNSSNIFYAGIFDDADYKTLSTKTEANVIPLDLAGENQVTVSVQARLAEGETYTLYITETDANGNPVDPEKGFAYAVTVDNGEITMGEKNLNADVVITNQEQETEVTPTATPAITSGASSGTGNSSGNGTSYSSGNAVKTGDDTPIALYMALLILAFATIAVIVKRRDTKAK